jgi:hypothetical protein
MVATRMICSGVAALLAAGLVNGPAAGQVVGKAGAVNPDTTASGRTVTVGANVIHKERIRTDARGTLQLMFNDRSTITIGPNSDMVIDEYVFDPNRGAGKMTVSLGKGVMRFVGGQISHSGEATVKTPPATIGIRGGVAVVSLEGRAVTATNVFGSVSITLNVGPSTGTQSFIPQGQTGSFVPATATSAPSVTTAPTTQQQINSQNQQLQSRGGQTGGAGSSTSSSAASTSNRSTSTTATITPASAPAAGSTASGPSSTARASGGGGSGPPSSGGSSPSSSNQFSGGTPPTVSTTNQSVQTSSGNTATQASTSGGTGGPPLPPGCPPVCP